MNLFYRVLQHPLGDNITPPITFGINAGCFFAGFGEMARSAKCLKIVLGPLITAEPYCQDVVQFQPSRLSTIATPPTVPIEHPQAQRTPRLRSSLAGWLRNAEVSAPRPPMTVSTATE